MKAGTKKGMRLAFYTAVITAGFTAANWGAAALGVTNAGIDKAVDSSVKTLTDAIREVVTPTNATSKKAIEQSVEQTLAQDRAERLRMEALAEQEGAKQPIITIALEKGQDPQAVFARIFKETIQKRADYKGEDFYGTTSKNSMGATETKADTYLHIRPQSQERRGDETVVGVTRNGVVYEATRGIPTQQDTSIKPGIK